MNQKLLVEDLQLGYRSTRSGKYSEACRDLSFEVRNNEFVAIVGPSGCGKTTFLSAVAGLQPVSDGKLHLNGKQINGPGSTSSAWRARGRCTRGSSRAA